MAGVTVAVDLAARSWGRRALLSAMALMAVAGMGCSRSPTVTRGYILISIDTLRADHLGCYGHDRETSPFIDSLAQRGVLFENAYVQLPGTLPSHMSIFTGLYPAEHGVYPPTGILSKKIKTLPEFFSSHGFRTAGHTEGGYVHGAFGFARGFDEFNDESWKIEDDIERTLARAEKFLESLKRRDRFFLFLHTYAIHDPYPDIRSPDAHYFDFETYLDPFWSAGPPAGSAEPTGPRMAELNRSNQIPGTEVLDYYRAAYDAQIRYVDDQLRGFFKRLETLGLSDDVTVVLTSDHGEEFGEHGRLLHEQIYRETLHVPLILLHPDLEAGRRVREVVQSIDIAPTLQELTGIESSWEMSGRSLFPLLGDEVPARPHEAYAEGLKKIERSLVRQTGDGVHQLLWWPRSIDDQGQWMSRELSFDTFDNEIVGQIESFHQPRSLEIDVDGEVLDDLGSELPVERGGVWVSRAVAFDHPGEQVRLTLQSFHRPRWVEVRLGPEKLTESLLTGTVLTGRRAKEAIEVKPGEARIETDPVTLEFTIPRGKPRRLRLRTEDCDVPAELGLSADQRCLGFQLLNVEGLERIREVSRRILVGPQETNLHLDLPPGGKKRVTLRADSCGVPAELGLSDDPRCLSFRLSLPDLWHLELFDNLGDPRQTRDLSSERSDLSLPMLRALNRYQFEPVAPAASGQLEPRLEDRLRALGYLP